jgi:hypothetical protein
MEASEVVIWIALSLSFIIFASVVSFVALGAMGRLDSRPSAKAAPRHLG